MVGCGSQHGRNMCVVASARELRLTVNVGKDASSEADGLVFAESEAASAASSCAAETAA